VAQLEGPAILDRATHVDLLVGTHNLHRVPELLARAAEGGAPAVDLDRRADPFAIPVSLVAHANPVRATSPRWRAATTSAASACAADPRPGGAPAGRGDPIRDGVARRAGLPRGDAAGPDGERLPRWGSRFSPACWSASMRPRACSGCASRPRTPSTVDGSMTRALSRLERLCPYLHLPFQSGSNRILASMRRGLHARGLPHQRRPPARQRSRSGALHGRDRRLPG